MITLGDPRLPVAVWAKIQPLDNGCWEWTGYVLPDGYGQMQRNTRLHVYTYTNLVGPIATGLTLDHLCHTNDPTCPAGAACRHRRCCNPAHLEPVTREENIRRGGERLATCLNGHPWTPESTYIHPQHGRRNCLICRREATAVAQAKRAQEFADGLAEGIRHGTLYAYTNYRCRCDLCRQCNTDYQREYTRRNPAVRARRAATRKARRAA